MRLPQFDSARTKGILHAVQGFVIFLGWALTIAVFTRDGPNDGRTAWYFAMCWFSIPALIYLAAVPMWPRTRRFGNPYAFAAVDSVFALLWFTAWVAVATYVGAGKSAEPANDEERKAREGKEGCDAFAFGSPGKCKLSTGTVILGVMVFLLFIGTSYLSVRTMMEYRRTGMMPYDGTDPTFAAHSKAAFSSNPAQDFDEEEGDDREFRSGRVVGAGAGGDNISHAPSSLGQRTRDDDEYALLQQNELDDMHGGRPAPSYDPTAPGGGGSGSSHPPVIPMPDVHGDGTVMHDYDTSYGGPYSHRPHSPNDYGMSTYGR